jgi:hypothetical protein
MPSSCGTSTPRRPRFQDWFNPKVQPHVQTFVFLNWNSFVSKFDTISSQRYTSCAFKSFCLTRPGTREDDAPEKGKLTVGEYPKMIRLLKSTRTAQGNFFYNLPSFFVPCDWVRLSADEVDNWSVGVQPNNSRIGYSAGPTDCA